MAATAAYLSILSIPSPGSVSEAKTFINVGSTTAAFSLLGGLYGVTFKASTYGTVTLQRLADDATTWVTALTAFSADGYASINLPPGSYRFALS